MSRVSPNLTGAAGEHFVVYKLSSLGLVAALPRAGATGVDVLVSNSDGSRTVAIQVKTTDNAVRTRGRGTAKVPFQLQFPLGYKCAKIDNPELLFAFVDLRDSFDHSTQPDVYLVPAPFVNDYCQPWVESVALVRLHIDIAAMQPFKNAWEIVLARLMPNETDL